MNGKVSIIVPVYKVENYLDRCVDSIVNQTYRNLEIILVDDGSPDRCPQMCDEWAERDERIIAIHQMNAGVGMSRNAGMEIATGEYLMFVDSDDYLSDCAVEVLYQRMVQDGSDMAVGKHVDVYDDGTTNDSFCRWMQDAVISKEMMLSQMGENYRYSVMSCMKLYKRSALRVVRFPSLSCGEDCYVFPLIMEQCRKISVVKETVYYYFQRSTSILHQMTDQRRMDDIKANLHLVKYLLTNSYIKAAQKWYGISVDKATHLKKCMSAREYIRYHFSARERRELLKGVGLKGRLKWMSLFVPVVLTARRWIIQEKRKKNAERN